MHTPGPWRTFDGDSVVNILGPNGQPIAATTSKSYYERHDATDRANAARIVLAVNSHDALVEALKAAHDCLGTGGCTERARVATRKQIRAALKDAAS